MQSQLPVVDSASGAIVGGVLVYVPAKARIKEGWFMGFQEGFLQLAKDRHLAGQPLRVLLGMLSKLDFENFIAFSQAELAEQLKINPTRVSESVKRLRERGVILTGPRVGSMKTYRLNPGYAWKGNVRTLDRARRDHVRLVRS
jgi:hypothetical protein